jgi:hypothetical protein
MSPARKRRRSVAMTVKATPDDGEGFLAAGIDRDVVRPRRVHALVGAMLRVARNELG